ncbi:pilus assembly protein PilW [Cupriavidus necator]|uniref:Pilus assembly protein PilW n=1 Tax=Cupriavidus necator TaxID=106590 RepID=A0A1U9UJP3_CUPNE|nr:PilW family protein [Cupriavidus necator]AQV92779.1 pilus assembly protein PilW [Cupriavidus necator]
MKHSVHPRPRSPAHRHQAGLSLVELMVAITISLFLLAGITALISQQSGARAELDKSGRQIESGRYAFTLLQDDIEHAGYYGQYAQTIQMPAALPNPCATDAVSIDASLALPLQGYDSPVAVPSPLSTCLPDANHVSGTDILVVRRLETDDPPPSIASAVAGQVYVQATPGDRKTGIGPDPSSTLYTLVKKDGVTPAELRRYIEHIYFVSPCNLYAAGATTCTAAADGGKPVPTLKRLEISASGGSTVFVTTPLADGIDNLQLDYGVDGINSGSPATPFITAPALADWPNVMAVQVNLLARNTQASMGYSDSKTYSMGVAGTVGPFSDAYKRHVYTGTVRAINPSGRRE